MANSVDYSQYENDVDFGVNPSKGSEKDLWYKGQTNMKDLASFVYFSRFDVNAVNEARRLNPRMSMDDIQKVANKAIAARAAHLDKPVDQLTDYDLTDLSTVKFRKLRFHYQEGLGYVISRLGMDGPEADKVWKRLPEPKVCYTSLMIFYPCTKQGDMIKDKETFQNGWSVRPWRMSEPTYQEFEKLANSLKANDASLASQDFKLECLDSKFQKFKPEGAGKAFWQKNPEFAKQVIAKATEWHTKLNPFRELSTDELLKKLGGGSGLAGQLTSGSSDDDSDFDSALQSV